MKKKTISLLVFLFILVIVNIFLGFMLVYSSTTEMQENILASSEEMDQYYYENPGYNGSFGFGSVPGEGFGGEFDFGTGGKESFNEGLYEQRGQEIQAILRQYTSFEQLYKDASEGMYDNKTLQDLDDYFKTDDDVRYFLYTYNVDNVFKLFELTLAENFPKEESRYINYILDEAILEVNDLD
jgi:hypothetical protein